MKSIFYKEWIKTGKFLIIATLLLSAFASYEMLRIAKAVSINGAAHIWEVMLARDMIFINYIQFVPLFVGILLALFQFIPEMRNACFKLTLHLPIPNFTAAYSMLFYGAITLFAAFLIPFLIMLFYLQTVFAPELYWRILLTALPWFLSGFAAYFLLSWICLEPTWRLRIPYILLAVLTLRIYHLNPAPEAYNKFLPILTIFTLLLSTLAAISVARFKIGKQD